MYRDISCSLLCIEHLVSFFKQLALQWPIISFQVLFFSGFVFEREKMGLSCSESIAGYPDQDVLIKKWRDNISPWLRNILQSVAHASRDQAKEVFNDELVSDLLAREDSPQKFFDMYGVAEFLNLLKENERCKDLLVKLSEILPYTAIYTAISNICAKLCNHTERLVYLEKALENDPGMPELLSDIGGVLINLDQRDRGFELIRKAVEKKPESSVIYSNYLFRCHFAEELDCEHLFAEHKKWAKIHADADYIKDHKNDPVPDRKLRIGYISPDFRLHPIGILMNPVFRLHNRNKFEVFGYSNVQQWDKFTDVIKDNVDTYRLITGRNTMEVVDTILDDKIDVLVDLAGHTGYNRLDVMAHKPAPVQASYLGYFETTGIEQIDYFLTDENMSPPQSRKYHAEKLFYLPGTCLSFQETAKKTNLVPSPVLNNGYVTFGMFSNPTKITRKIARLWGRILSKVENSKLKILVRGGNNEDFISIYYDLLEQCGLPMDRVQMQGELSLDDYMAAYNQVDIMFDTYPYNGGMTTCDAFWMGVPVVSLVGEHHFSRVGLSLLSSVGLEYFAAGSEDEYIAKACALAAMPESLAKIRQGLRQRMLSTPLGNTALQTRNLENAYREMWLRWCFRDSL